MVASSWMSTPDPVGVTPDVVAILLAAGHGRRFDASGKTNKLLSPLVDKTVVETTAGNILAAQIPVLAVIRPEQSELRRRLEALGCEVTGSAMAQHGMGHSLAAAAARLIEGDEPAPAALICLADMPFIRSSTYSAVAEAVVANDVVVAAAHNGVRGNPVGFPNRYLVALATLSGDSGAGSVLRASAHRLLECNDAAVLRDIDTPADLSSQAATAAHSHDPPDASSLSNNFWNDR